MSPVGWMPENTRFFIAVLSVLDIPHLFYTKMATNVSRLCQGINVLSF